MTEKYNELIKHKPHNAYYDRPNTLKLIPNVKGKSMLDAACRPGKYAEILLAQGVMVTGFDISPKMVKLELTNAIKTEQFFLYTIYFNTPLTFSCLFIFYFTCIKVK